jgi:predicted RNase H-like HicB family nuclease
MKAKKRLIPEIEIYYDHQCKVWVAKDSTLGIATQAESRREAKKAIDEAIMLFLITFYEHGMLGKFISKFK